MTFGDGPERNRRNTVNMKHSFHINLRNSACAKFMCLRFSFTELLRLPFNGDFWAARISEPWALPDRVPRSSLIATVNS